jgi:aminopeptidase 2
MRCFVTCFFDALFLFYIGASVIRMLEDFLSREAFSKGVNLYLKEFAYKNATTKDLWKALSTASSINVEMVMNTWVEKVGYPVITVVKEDYDEEKKVMNLTLKQERFLSFKSVSLSDSSLDSSVWFVPVTVLTDSFPVATRHLEAKEGVISFPYTPSEKSFYKLNANGIGFYRIGYSSLQMNRILQTLAGQQSCLFSVQDRLQLINDAFACAKAGVAETSTALQLLDSFKNESSGIVLATISFWLSAVEETFALDENIRNGIKTLTRNIFASLVSTVGFDYSKNEDYLMLKKRTTIIKAAANANDPRYF